MTSQLTPIMVLGSPTRTAAVAAGLQRAGLLAKTLTARDAHRSPGLTSDAPLNILAWPPGRHPVVESEIYGSATGALHVWWHARGAVVGPYVVPGFGPCPACLATSTTAQSERGAQTQLTSWAASWAALQTLAVLEHGTTELMGLAWTWSLDNPGLSLITWPWRPNCATRGCYEA